VLLTTLQKKIEHYRGSSEELPCYHRGGPRSVPDRSVWVCGAKSGIETGFSFSVSF